MQQMVALPTENERLSVACYHHPLPEFLLLSNVFHPPNMMHLKGSLFGFTVFTLARIQSSDEFRTANSGMYPWASVVKYVQPALPCVTTRSRRRSCHSDRAARSRVFLFKCRSLSQAHSRFRREKSMSISPQVITFTIAGFTRASPLWARTSRWAISAS